MKNTTSTQFAVWAIALLVAGSLLWSAIRHHMPLLDTAAMFLLCLHAGRAGAQNLVDILGRRNGGAR